MPNRTTAAGPSEAAWQAKVEGLARFYGWRIFHAPDNRPVRARSGRTYVQNVTPGFPDLVLLRPPELIFAELKTDKGRVKPEQEEWLADLRAVAATVNLLAGFAERDGLATHIDVEGEVIPLTLADERRGEAVGRYPALDVYVWRPGDLEAVNDRLSRGADKARADSVGPC